MSEDDQQVEALGRQAFEEAGRLRLLAERMTTLSWQADGYPPAELLKVADTLQGMALRCAMSTGNTDMLNELTGREFRARPGDLTGDL